MNSADLLVDAFNRISEVAHQAVTGLSPEQLAYRPDSEANSIAWLAWHLTRIQDDRIARIAGTEPLWSADGWAERFALPLDNASTGFGHTSSEVAAVQVESPDLLTGYLDAVNAATARFVHTISEGDLDRFVGESADPQVRAGALLMQIISSEMQHAGQAAYLRGLIERQ